MSAFFLYCIFYRRYIMDFILDTCMKMDRNNAEGIVLAKSDIKRQGTMMKAMEAPSGSEREGLIGGRR